MCLNGTCLGSRLTLGLVTTIMSFSAAQIFAQDATTPEATNENPRAATPALPTPPKVDVLPASKDSDIARRLTNIMSATQWFNKPRTDVKEGVVFLYGDTSSQAYKDWATDLATKTQDVAAVVNRIEVRESSLWDLTPLESEMGVIFRKTVLSVPYVILGLIILVLAIWTARLSMTSSLRVLETHYETPLLREVLAKAIGILIFLIGLYLVLRIFGLTRLAVTVLGGTGLVGLVLGIAFRDITENFLASILLSVQNPFRPGDLVQIGSDTGYVQRLNARTTVLMTLDGNSLQIPNATVYKSTITNWMSNPNRRESFIISIGYGDSISEAQTCAMQVLQEHPVVLKEPEPWVLVDSLTPEYVNLKVYYWINAKEHSALKVRSSIIRLVKISFQQHGIQLPAAPGAALAANQLLQQPPATRSGAVKQEKFTTPVAAERSDVATQAEAGLKSDEKQLLSQARQARRPEDGQNLLKVKGSAEDDVPQQDNAVHPAAEPALRN